MRIRHGLAPLGAALFLAACTASGGDMDFSSAALETNDQKASYGIGMNVARQLMPTEGRLDRQAFMRGLEDHFAGRDPAVAPEDLQAIFSQFNDDLASAAQEEAAAFLEENGARDGVTTTESGLQYEVITAGAGPTPGPDDQVRIHYRGTLADGTEFDSSYGGEPAQFGVGGVIQGFSEALQLMNAGSHWRIVIPSEIGYGAQGSGGAIPPNATLIFEIELLEIVGG